MTEFDEGTTRAIAQLRESWDPPPGVEEPLLASIHARLEGGPGGGGSGGQTGGGSPSGEIAGGSQLGYAAKVAGATLAAAGLLGLVLVFATKDMREPAAPTGVSVVAEVEASTRPEPGPNPPEALDEVTTRPMTKPSEATVEASTLELDKHEPKLRTRRSPHLRPSVQPEPEQDTSGPNLEAELALMREAKAARGTEALKLLAQHEHEFPKGTLASERDGLRIIALCELGRLDDARPRLESFVAAHPRSLQLPRLRSTCSAIDFPSTDPTNPGDGSK